MSYATVEQMREYLQQVKESAENDVIMAAALERATDLVNDTLGFQFASYGAVATTRDVRGQGDEWLRPPAYQADSIESIELVSGRGESSESLDEVTDWLVEEDERPYQIYRCQGWQRRAWYRITAIWGYGPVPDAIVEVTIEARINIWRGRDAANWQTTIGAEGQGTVGFNRALTWAQRSIIEGVRRRYLGVVHA